MLGTWHNTLFEVDACLSPLVLCGHGSSQFTKSFPGGCFMVPNLLLMFSREGSTRGSLHAFTGPQSKVQMLRAMPLGP